EEYRKFIEIENKFIINKAESNITTYYPRGTVKENKTYDLITLELYYQDEIGLRKAYEDWKKRINKRQINDNTNKLKRLKIFSYCQEPAEIEHVNEIIERYSKIDANKGPNIINNLEYTCEMWKKKVETLRGVTKKFKEEDPNELKKQKEYKPNNLNYIDEFKMMIKYPYEPDNPERYKAANKVNLPNIEIPRKDKAQLRQLLQDLKSKP
ncbi:35375_t:CDS:2, partial [Gigaspora margarita]